MTTAATALGDLLAAPITVAEPDVVGALAVFPLIAGAGPRLEYLARPAAAVGLGTALGFEFGGLAGTGLSAEDELVTVTAFAT